MALLKRYSEQVVEFLKGVEGVVDLDTSLDLGKPEVRVRADRARAASLGVDPYELAPTLRTLIGGNEEQVTKFKDTARGEEYEVRVRLAEEFRNNPDTIADLPIRTRDGFVKLGSFATVSRDLGPTQLQRYARQRQVVVTGNLQGIGVGDVQSIINERFKPDQFEPGYSFTYLGRGSATRRIQRRRGHRAGFFESGAEMGCHSPGATSVISVPSCSLCQRRPPGLLQQ